MFLVLCFSLVALVSGDKNCRSCATPGLLANWRITGYPIQPNITYDALCAHITQPTAVDVPCTSMCVEMIIPLGNGNYEALRGCHTDFVGSYTKEFSLGSPVCKSFGSDFTANILNVCVPPEDKICNTNAYISTQNKPIVPDSCTVATPTHQCISCSNYDGKGKCSDDDKNVVNAPICLKTQGKLNDNDYVERTASFLIAADTPNFCLPLETSELMYYGPGSGVNSPGSKSVGKRSVTYEKRAVNQYFNGVNCYCNDKEKCNGAPTVVGASLSLVVLLTALPFFC